MRCRWCVGFACEVNAKCGTQNTVIPKALATGSCELRTGCMTRQILTDARGRVTGVEFFDAHDRVCQQDADLVVVSGAAVESARLLLNSKSALFPAGLGNRYDWVGRNLQGHSYTGAFGIMPHDIYDDLGPGASIAVCDYNHGNAGLAGGAMLANEFIRRAIAIQGPTQEMPMFSARVEVDPQVRDHWGIPVARLSGDKHPHTIEIGAFAAARAEEWLKEAGAVRTWKKLAGPGFTGGQHQAGTCRMGDDPKTSVVNRDCRVHEIDNLFVIDGSVHVTNGGFNPVLTIMANAYRASESLVKGWKGTGYR
jgi:choline dehydrogenase-like flavoprotein